MNENFVFQKSKRAEIALTAGVYILNIIILPAIFFMTGGICAGAPFLLVIGIASAFFLDREVLIIPAALIAAVWDMFIMTFAYYYPEKLPAMTLGLNERNGSVAAYLVAACSALAVLIACGYTNWRIKKNIEGTHRFIETIAEVKSKFLANTTGELRTPMNAILTMTELLEREDDGSGHGDEVAIIKESAFSLLAMINNILTYSELDGGNVQAQSRQFHFATMLKDLIYTVSMELADKNVLFFANINPSIPEVLYGDESKIKQIFKYVFNNSVQNTMDGRIILNVDYRTNEGKNSVTILVKISDTGAGLSEDEKESVFNSFEIYDSRKYSQLKKIGLELTICRELLKLMDGGIDIESIDGIGTCVSFDFEVFGVERTPLIESRSMSSERSLVYMPDKNMSDMWSALLGQFSVAGEIVNSTGSFIRSLHEKNYDHIFVYDSRYAAVEKHIKACGDDEKCFVITDYKHKFGDFGNCRILRRPVSCLNLADALYNTWLSSDYLGTLSESSFVAPRAKVLVVDNNMLDLHMVAGLLERFGINASIATSGKEALDKCSRQLFDLVLLNQSMPVMDGIQTLKELRGLADERYAAVPVVCMSSTMKYEARESFVSMGFQELMIKPVRRAPLESVLRSCLGEELIEEPVIGSADEDHEKTGEVPEGLLADVGLSHSGGDEDVYCAILNTYYVEGIAKIDEIKGSCENGDLKRFTIDTHAVKGSSAGIGGMEVSKLFEALEAAGKTEDTVYIEAHLDDSIQKYRELLDEVRGYLEQRGKLEAENVSNEDMELSDFEVSEMRQFKEAAEDFDTPALEALLEKWTGENYGKEKNSYVSGLKRACDSFEYDKAIDLADEFLRVFG